MADEELLPEESGQNIMLQDAIDALRKGDRARARDILTRLLKVEQNNAMYWIWLSAAVDTRKERLYCLQSALQIDPNNASAKRGLTMMGGIPPDDSVEPFPLNHPRQWEEKITPPQEPKEQKRDLKKPLVRVLASLAAALAVLAVAYFGFLSPDAFVLKYLNRPRRLYVTITFTPTGTIYSTSVLTRSAPTPLAQLLSVTYTPTPLYVVTPHTGKARSDFDAALRFFQAGDYDNAITMFKQALSKEPGSVDLYYYLGESNRMKALQDDAMGDAEKARENLDKAWDYYQTAINLGPEFAPSYLGRAQVNLAKNPDTDVSTDLDQAITLDPNFLAAYIERGAFLRVRGYFNAALKDLQTALQMNPGSALAYLYLAQVQLDMGDNQAALESAVKANQLDLTLVPSYLVVAQAYIANGQNDKASGALETYTLYAPEDISAYLTLGAVYNALGKYQAAVDVLSQYIIVHPLNSKGYYQRGTAYLNLGNAPQARDDFRASVGYDPNNFDAQLGLGRAIDMMGFPGDAYIQVEQNCPALAKTDAQKAQVHYWEAVWLEKMDKKSAAKESWRRLLQLPAGAMPEAWRDEAFAHLGITPTITPTPRVTATPLSTPSP